MRDLIWVTLCCATYTDLDVQQTHLCVSQEENKTTNKPKRQSLTENLFVSMATFGLFEF
jgi:hypothetical protein